MRGTEVTRPVERGSDARGRAARQRRVVIALVLLSGCKLFQCKGGSTSSSADGGDGGTESSADTGNSLPTRDVSFPDVPAIVPFTPQIFVSTLTAAEVVPQIPCSVAPQGTVGQGTFTLRRPDGYHFQLQYEVTESLTDGTYAFIYAGVPGEVGEPVASLEPPPGNTSGFLELSDDQVEQLQAEGWYLVIMSASFPSGAARGQILLQAETGQTPVIFEAPLTGLLAQPPNNSTAQATVSVILDTTTNEVEVTLAGTADITSFTLQWPGSGGTSMPFPVPSAPLPYMAQVPSPLEAGDAAALEGGYVTVTATLSTTPPTSIAGVLLGAGSQVLVGSLTGAQVVPPVATTETGSALLSLDYCGTTVHVVGSSNAPSPLSVSLVADPPLGPSVIATSATDGGSPAPDAGPADAGSTDAGTTTDGGCVPANTDAGPSGPAVAFDISSPALTAPQLQAILDGEAEVVVATAAHPSGEIAGRVTQPGEQVFQAPLLGGLAIPSTASTRTGTAWAYLSADQSTVRVAIETTFGVSGVTWDQGLPGSPQSSETELSLPGGDTAQYGVVSPVSPSAATALTQGLWRIFISTGLHPAPASEVGGQFEPPGSTLYVAQLSGAQALPPSGSHSHPQALFIVDALGQQISVVSNAAPESSSVFVARGLAGTAGDPLSPPLAFNNGIWTASASLVSCDGWSLTDLQRGLWYVESDQGLTVRGQVLAPGETVYESALSYLNMVPPTGTGDTGNFQFVLNPSQTELIYDGTISARGPLNFELYPCTNGVAINVMQEPITSQSVSDCPPTAPDCVVSETVSSKAPVNVNSSTLTALESGGLCALVTSVQQPSGDARGVVVPAGQ